MLSLLSSVLRSNRTPADRQIRQETNYISSLIFRRLDRPSQKEVSRLAKTVTRSVKTDPAQRQRVEAQVPKTEEYYTAVLYAALREGNVYVVEAESKIVTVLVFFRSPAKLFGSEAQKRLGYNNVVKSVSEKSYKAEQWWKEYVAQIENQRRKLFSPMELDELWSCDLCVTDWEDQMHAYDYESFAMNRFYDTVCEDEEILGMMVTSEEAAIKFTSMGFRERGRTIVKGPSAIFRDYPVIWMSRE